ncbi:phosphoglycerate kinase [Candidatus Woesebacteria bacterium]|nr:phosphoglycerate kinase [Candidatus Woesebacteria bacterium]
MKSYHNLNTPKISDVANKTVLVRVDYNVPLESQHSTIVVKDDKRIAQSVETIHFLIKAGAKIVLLSHLGRPKSASDAHLSLEPVAQHLQKKFHIHCQFYPATVGEKVIEAVAQLRSGEVLLLENLRFHPEEKAADNTFAKQLAKLGDIYINEAFSSLHRKHASTYVLPQLLPNFAGFDLAREVATLEKLLTEPRRPFICLIGGAKIADKVDAIKVLASKADAILIGGGIANNFFKAEGLEIYRSFTQEVNRVTNDPEVDYTKMAGQLIAAHKHERLLKDGYIPLPKIIYPIDVVAAPSITETDRRKLQTLDLSHDMLDKPEHEKLVFADIGPKTIRLYRELLMQAETIFWNGPMGVWENDLFANGTHKLACAVADATATSVIGGGDTIGAIDHFGLGAAYSYISTGGGASLEFLSGTDLPGLEVLTNK